MKKTESSCDSGIKWSRRNDRERVVMWCTMDVDDVVDVIREKLFHQRLSGKTPPWSTILTEIAKNDSFGGKYADTILEAIHSFLESLDDRTVISIWRQSESGMGD